MESHDPTSAPRILVVEDNEISRKLVVMQLQALGYDAETVASGEEALEVFSPSRHDLVLMDCELPELDGYETTRRLRKRESEGEHTPVIALTVHARPTSKSKCLEAGMDDFLTKPLKQPALESALGRWLTDNGPEGRGVEDPIDRRQIEAVKALGEKTGEDLLAQLVESLERNGPDLIFEIKAAVEREQADRVAELAHRLRGSVAFLGAIRMSAMCSELELRAGRGNLEHAADAIRSIKSEGVEVMRLLRRVVAESSARAVGDGGESPAGAEVAE